MALCRARVRAEACGRGAADRRARPPPVGPESWVRREGWAGAKAKGRPFLRGSAVALTSQTARGPRAHLAFRFSREEDKVFIRALA